MLDWVIKSLLDQILILCNIQDPQDHQVRRLINLNTLKCSVNVINKLRNGIFDNVYRLLSIFLSLYFLAGSILLPSGNFGVASQLTKLYDQFIQLNGQASFDEFFVEEFLDPYEPPDNENEPGDEPFEKEQHPVPVDFIAINSNNFMYINNSGTKIDPELITVSIWTPYKDDYSSIYQETIFHPPRSIFF
jgi:hypothetical protein